MADERISFEFYYDYGFNYGSYHYGWLPRREFEALVRGKLPLATVHDIVFWSEEEGAFVRWTPGGSGAEGSPVFRAERMTRIWPVSMAGTVAQDQQRVPPLLLRRKLEEFFGGPLVMPQILQVTLAQSDLPNFERAMDDFVSRDVRGHELIGVLAADHFDYHPSFRRIVTAGSKTEENVFPVRVGAPEWKRLAVDVDRHRDCLCRGIHLLETGKGKAALAVWPKAHESNYEVEVLARDVHLSRAVLDDVRDGMSRLSIYRGKVIELQPQRGGCDYEVAFASLRVPTREEIVLPDGQLDLIERNALAPLRHRERLLAAGRHLRRGLLFHGKPGAGKTLTARYLVGRLEGYTIVLLTGPTLGLLPQACRLARALSPSAVILEDVDLIARERGENERASLLHDLLDEMDGLSPKIEMVFLLTTNRPDLLEPALAARPGRIDQAIEFHLPDKAARRRLFELYARGLPLEADLEAFLDRTEGASGAFIEEWLRRALVFAAEEASPTVRTAHVEQALRELVLSGGEFTRSLMGFVAGEKAMGGGAGKPNA